VPQTDNCYWRIGEMSVPARNGYSPSAAGQHLLAYAHRLRRLAPRPAAATATLPVTVDGVGRRASGPWTAAADPAQVRQALVDHRALGDDGDEPNIASPGRPRPPRSSPPRQADTATAIEGRGPVEGVRPRSVGAGLKIPRFRGY